jgi:cytochrome c5
MLIVAACSTTHSVTFKPTESDAAKVSTPEKKVTLADLQSGFNLYVSNCGGCHNLHAPSSKSKEKWNKVLPEMFSKIQISPEKQDLIKQYIFSKL